MTDDSTASAGEHLRNLGDDVGALIREELQQAQAEMAEKARQAAKGAVLIAAAGVLAAAAAGTSTVFLIRVLDRFLPPRTAAATASAALGGASAALVLRGLTELQPARPLLPEQTVRRMRRNAEAAGDTHA